MTDQSRETGGGQARRWSDWLGLALFAAAAVSTVLWLMILGHGLTFFFDEWDFIEAAGTTGYTHNVLRPHNGHPSMVPFSVYEILLKTVGLRHYWPYQLFLALLDVACGWFLFVLLRRKLPPVAAGAAAAALMLLGPAWEDLLWPFQIGFLGSVAGGLAALALLDRGTKRADLGACGCLLISIGCSGVGLPFLAGVAVELLWRRRSWRRLWIPALPTALFVVWYETIGKSSSTTVSAVTVVHSMASDTSTTVGALVGHGATVGAVLSAVLAAMVIVALVRSPGRAARLAMAVSGLLTFWMLTLLARGVSQDSASRYLYPAAAFILIGIGELPRLIGRATPARRRRASAPWARISTAVVMVAAVAYTGAAIWWNAGTLADGSAFLAGVSNQVGAELGAVVLAGSALPAKFRPDGKLMPQVQTGPFQATVAAFGSPGDSRRSLEDRADPYGSLVDSMLLRGRPMAISPAVNSDGILKAGSGCVQSALGPGSPTVTFTLSSRGSAITAPKDAYLAMRAKALSASFPGKPFNIIPPGKTIVLSWSRASTSIHWTVKLSPLPQSVPVGSVATVCPVTTRVITRNAASGT